MNTNGTKTGLLENESASCIVLAPKKEDKLFCGGEDYSNNARIAKWDADWAYSSGYRAAAFSLAQKVCDTQHEQDILIYPIVYLYRHHIELTLKSITFHAFSLLDKEMTDDDLKSLRSSHNLKHLWSNLRPLLNPVCKLVQENGYPLEDLEGIESYINQLDEHDPDGQRFRYSTIKKSKKSSEIQPSLNAGLHLINIRIFADGMERLAEYLDCMDSWFSDILTAKWDAQRADF